MTYSGEREIPPRSAGIREIIAETSSAYDAEAAYYAESTKNYDSYPGLRDEVLEFVELVGPDEVILDLGCGGGRDAGLISSLGRRVIAGDLAMNMVRQSRMRISPESAGRVGFTRLDMLSLPVRDAALGGIWACGSLLHVPSQALPVVLRELVRTLLPGGVAAISMREGATEGWRSGGSLPGRRWFTFVDPEDFARLMRTVGFAFLTTRYSGRPGWFVTTGRKAY